MRTLADLTRPGLKLVLAERAVPVGDATRRALDRIAASGTYGGISPPASCATW